jgi:hypothetical protein
MNAAFPCGSMWTRLGEYLSISIVLKCRLFHKMELESAHPMQFQPACFNCWSELLNENDINWEGDCRRGFWKAFQKLFLVNSWPLLLGSILVETFFEQTN